MCVHYVGHNSCLKFKCEKVMLNPCILCANACKNRDVHMRCDVVELSEKSWLNVTTKVYLKVYKMLFELSYNLTYKIWRNLTSKRNQISWFLEIWFGYVTWEIWYLKIIFKYVRSLRIEPKTSQYVGCWKI